MTKSNRLPSTSGGDDGMTDHSLLLNALRDLVEDSNQVIADSSSRSILADAYQFATSKREREDFVKILDVIHQEGSEDQDSMNKLQSILEQVADELNDRIVRTELVHETKLEIPNRTVGLYNYSRTKEPNSLEILSLSDSVHLELYRAACHAAEGDYSSGIKACERGIEESVKTDDAIAGRVLAGWLCHWSGDDETALNYVNEALELHRGAWSALLLHAIVNHPSPKLFRKGYLSSQAYLRIRSSDPTRGAIRADVGYYDDGEDLNWEELRGDLGLLRLPRLASQMWIRIKVFGLVDRMPNIDAYYVAVGIVDDMNDVPRSVEYQPMTGPVTSGANEKVRFIES